MLFPSFQMCGAPDNRAAQKVPCICEPAYQDSSGCGRPNVPGSRAAVGEQGSPRPLANASIARTVGRAVPPARARIGQGRAGRQPRSRAVTEEVYVGIDVSKAELVVAVRPGGERMTLTNDRAGIKRLVGRLGELKPRLVVVEADRRVAAPGGGGAVDRGDRGGGGQSVLGAELCQRPRTAGQDRSQGRGVTGAVCGTGTAPGTSTG